RRNHVVQYLFLLDLYQKRMDCCGPWRCRARGPMTKIDWHLLESFRVAGRLQHVTRAAEQLGTSQPALSRALARLHADMGVPLFERAGRSLRLTRYGELFLARVERALGEVEEGRRELAD